MAQFGAIIALQNHKAPRREFAMVRNTRGNAQQFAQLCIIRPGAVILRARTERRFFKNSVVSTMPCYSPSALPAI